MIRSIAGCIGAVILSATPCAAQHVEFVVHYPNGSKSSPIAFAGGSKAAPFGSSLELRPTSACMCVAELVEIRIDGEPRTIQPTDLPVTFSTGNGLTGLFALARPAIIVFRAHVAATASIKSIEDAKAKVAESRIGLEQKRRDAQAAEDFAKQRAGQADEAAAIKEAVTRRQAADQAAVELAKSEAAQRTLESTSMSVEETQIRIEQQTWWAVADTIAYAVMRETGNTPIAGAGIFVDPFTAVGGLSDLFFRWKMPVRGRTQPTLDVSFVVHLLPPAEDGGPADIGISPLGIGVFERRVVMGIGWNISRQGLRDNSHNRYVYIGFSASELLSPKRPDK